MTNRKKSKKEQKIESSLGISSSTEEDFDMSDEIDSDDELEAQQQLEKRKEIATKTKNALSVYSEKKDEKGYEGDEEFSRDMLRDLAVTGMTILKIQEEEMQIDPSARNAETAASLINSVTTAVGKLTDIGHNRKKLDIDQQKANKDLNSVTNNFIGISSFSDLIKSIKDTGEDMGKVSSPDDVVEIEAEIIKESDDNEE